MNALEKAIAVAGNATKLAELLSTCDMNISHWRNRNGGRVPFTRVMPIYHATGVTPTNCAQISTQIPQTVYLNRSLNNANCFISTE